MTRAGDIAVLALVGLALAGSAKKLFSKPKAHSMLPHSPSVKPNLTSNAAKAAVHHAVSYTPVPKAKLLKLRYIGVEKQLSSSTAKAAVQHVKVLHPESYSVSEVAEHLKEWEKRVAPHNVFTAKTYTSIARSAKALLATKKGRYVAFDPETLLPIGDIPADSPNAKITVEAWRKAGYIVRLVR